MLQRRERASPGRSRKGNSSRRGIDLDSAYCSLPRRRPNRSQTRSSVSRMNMALASRERGAPAWCPARAVESAVGHPRGASRASNARSHSRTHFPTMEAADRWREAHIASRITIPSSRAYPHTNPVQFGFMAQSTPTRRVACTSNQADCRGSSRPCARFSCRRSKLGFPDPASAR
jgi:hypothetical protein